MQSAHGAVRTLLKRWWFTRLVLPVLAAVLAGVILNKVGCRAERPVLKTNAVSQQGGVGSVAASAGDRSTVNQSVTQDFRVQLPARSYDVSKIGLVFADWDLPIRDGDRLGLPVNVVVGKPVLLRFMVVNENANVLRSATLFLDFPVGTLVKPIPYFSRTWTRSNEASVVQYFSQYKGSIKRENFPALEVTFPAVGDVNLAYHISADGIETISRRFTVEVLSATE